MVVKESEYICPRCESDKTSQFRPPFIVASGIILVGIGAWTFSIHVVGIGFIILGSIMLIGSPLLKDVHICNRCRKLWKVKPVKKIPTEKIINFMERSQKYRKNRENK